MKQNYLVILNSKAVAKGSKYFASEAAELKFEQEMWKRYANSDNDYVDVIYY